MKDPSYLPRLLEPIVEEALEDHPIVVVTGARQTGKTTLVQNLSSAPERAFRTLDDLDVLEMARKRPEELLAQADRLTLDEIQRVPELLLSIKGEVDRRRRRGRFLLTGSANLLLMRSVADSLSGRAVYLYLHPLTGGERRRKRTAPAWSSVMEIRDPRDLLQLPEVSRETGAEWEESILAGGLPPAALARSARGRARWFEGYVRTYLERDLRDLSSVSSLPDFRRLMGLAAQRIGQLLNQTELGRDAGLTQPTAHRYLNLLETSFQIHRLPAYAVSRSKRLIKSPKVYWSDPGLASSLAGISSTEELRSSPFLGPLLENLVLTGLLAWRETCLPKPEIFYWRTAGGAEVDFVIESGKRLIPIEVKSAKRVRAADARHLEAFLDDYEAHASFGLLLHDRQGKPAALTRRVVAAPVSLFV